MTESSVASDRFDATFTDALRAELAVELLPHQASVEQRRAALLRALGDRKSVV